MLTRFPESIKKDCKDWKFGVPRGRGAKGFVMEAFPKEDILENTSFEYVAKDVNRREAKLTILAGKYGIGAPVFGLCRRGSKYRLIMQYLPGETLYDFIRLHALKTPDLFRKKWNDIYSVIPLLHRIGIAHNDINLTNIIVGEDIHIIDYGRAEEDRGMTKEEIREDITNELSDIVMAVFNNLIGLRNKKMLSLVDDWEKQGHITREMWKEAGDLILSELAKGRVKIYQPSREERSFSAPIFPILGERKFLIR